MALERRNTVLFMDWCR